MQSVVAGAIYIDDRGSEESSVVEVGTSVLERMYCLRQVSLRSSKPDR